MRVCPKCSDYSADRLLAFCPTDGTPLLEVDPSTDTWSEGVRILDRKASEVRTGNRKQKWQRVVRRAMLMTTMAVIVAAAYSSVTITVIQPRGELCIEAFNDLDSDGEHDANEPGLPGFDFRVSGTDAPKSLTTDLDGRICSNSPIGMYTVVEQPQSGWIATRQTERTVAVTASQTVNLLFGNLLAIPEEKKEKLCITKFDDLNGNGRQEVGEAGLAGFVFQVSGPGAPSTLTTGPTGVGCALLPFGAYKVVEQQQRGWIATTPTTQTVTIAAGQTANMLFGSKREKSELCITKFDDVNGNGMRDAGEPGLSGFAFQVSGTGQSITGPTGEVCSALPAGAYTVIEQQQRGWIATTPAKQTVTITAGQTANLLFGSRQERLEGRLCITKFDDVNGNGVRDAGEPDLSGFVFLVLGTGPATTLATPGKGDVCAALTVGTYTVVEQHQRGWTPTTATTRTVTLTSNQSTNLFFGNTKRGKPDSECTEDDTRREWQIIRARYEARWRGIIERERERIIAENAGTKAAEVSLGTIEYLREFRRCTLVLIALKYEWLVQSPKQGKRIVRRELRSVCEKTGGSWFCRQL